LATATSHLAGQHALVTGGGRGIGAATAAALTAEGARVTILGRNETVLQQAVQAGWAEAYVTADVTDEAGVAAAVTAAAARAGAVQILVANAGGAATAPFLKSDAAMFARLIELNLMGVVHAVRAVLPGMQAARAGRIVAIASTASLKGYAFTSAYVAAKHAVLGLVRSLALETARHGVTVNAVCPGFTQTDLVEDSIRTIVAKTGRSPEDAATELTKFNPQGRFVQPDEVANAVVWLCGRQAASVNGQAIAVDGGET